MTDAPKGTSTEPDELRFSTVKKQRVWYFVEYCPPQDGNWFATLDVQVHESATLAAVADAMESELSIWAQCYPIPVFVSAWDEAGDLYSLEGTRSSPHLVGYVDADTGEVKAFWRHVGDDEAPRAAPSNEELLRIYADVHHELTSETAREKAFLREMRSARIGKRLVVTWLVIWGAAIPAGVAVLEWAAPWWWLGVLVLAYSLYKAVRQALILIGIGKPSRRELEAQAKRNRMEMYYEECERNSEGFERLRIENLERETREQIQNEARELREAAKRSQ